VTFEHRPARREEVAARPPLELLREALPDVWLELGGPALEPATPVQVQPGRSVTLSSIVEDGVALAGDAAGCLDPFTGHGMALGLLDVATLAPLLARGDVGAGALRLHERARHARLAARREATEVLAAAFLDGVDGRDPLATALAARLGARWADPRVAPAVAAQAAGFDLPAPSIGERLFALGAL
jgi:2-polyprenyl-6-methoxyphenol hydroxylase-like FAD-dependent oxidoreductase